MIPPIGNAEAGDGICSDFSQVVHKILFYLMELNHRL
jgi:hypothetical protein